MTTSNLSHLNIENMIYVIRTEKVMLDSDLAELYGIDVKRLNEQVKRNLKRFPRDFMFQLMAEERDILRSQFATFNKSIGSRKYLPFVFTENGVAMLSSVLNSDRAIEVNIAIMRLFTKLRSFLMLEEKITIKMERLESNVNKVFKVVFQRLDDLDEATPTFKPDRKRIGLDKS
jgi:hypothetical protein